MLTAEAVQQLKCFWAWREGVEEACPQCGLHPS